MNIITWLIKFLETWLFYIGFAYFLDYAIDGDIDLPHKKVDFKKMGLYRIARKIYQKVKKK